MTERVLDTSAIERLQRIGGGVLARQMVDLFLEHGPQRVASAEAACAAEDPAGVEQAAHALRSSAGNVGARRLQQAAEAVEREAEAGRSAKLETLVNDMRAEYTAASAALNGLLVELNQ